MNERVLLPGEGERTPAVRRQSKKNGTDESSFTWSGHADELFYGQIVIVTARWILVATVLALALWNANSLGELRVQLLATLALAGMNFYIHAHLLMKRPFPAWAVFGATAVDLTVITVITAVQGGFSSNVFLFYFPAILGFSVAFPSMITILLVGATGFLYGVIALATGSQFPDVFLILTSRLIMLAGTAICGIVYQQLERKRRQEAVDVQVKLRAQVFSRSVSPMSPDQIQEKPTSQPVQEGV